MTLVIAVLHSKATSYLALLHSVTPYGAAQFYSFIYYVLSFSFSLLVLHVSCDAVKETNARKLNQCRVYQFNVFEVNWGNLSSDFLRIVIVAETMGHYWAKLVDATIKQARTQWTWNRRQFTEEFESLVVCHMQWVKLFWMNNAVFINYSENMNETLKCNREL